MPVPYSSYIPRVAIVTGGAQGIGHAIVQRLVDDGVDVAVNDVASKRDLIDKVVEEVRQKGRRAVAVPADVSSEADVSEMVNKTASELGSVDIMIANAGIFPFSQFLETPTEKFDKVLAVNARGVFLCFKLAALQMIKQGRGGRLIAASSVAGMHGQHYLTDYSASKFAVRGIVQCSAIELRDYGITANAYAPGVTATPENPGLPAEERAKLGPLGSAPQGNAEDLAAVVSFLARPDSWFVNGQTINANGAFFCT
ncbi:NAD-binding protein [Sanghuangporus baumii]|uniref:NAD-binding protein n=1 Tax=Sanghuangporus baumii TaxID=108892 RepID=A0A9Q5N817_SANBA|nr:NAD-binding protein [Sanghuangporus baumii]